MTAIRRGRVARSTSRSLRSGGRRRPCSIHGPSIPTASPVHATYSRRLHIDNIDLACSQTWQQPPPRNSSDTIVWVRWPCSQYTLAGPWSLYTREHTRRSDCSREKRLAATCRCAQRQRRPSYTSDAAMSDMTERTKTCGKCLEGWICEQHPALPWPHPDPSQPDGVCAGPGIPCDAPNCTYSLALLTPEERRAKARE